MGKVMAVVPAAGQGVRMGPGTKKKLFRLLAGKPVLAYCLLIFEACLFVDSIILVVADEDQDYCYREVVSKFNLKKVVKIVSGGECRQDSVFRGLGAVNDHVEVVIVHDGARPLVTESLIFQIVEAARIYGAVSCAVPLKDTLKMGDEQHFVTSTLPRDKLWLVQTPQAFTYQLLFDAHLKARKSGLVGTDDASLVEAVGHPVKLIPGSYENIKITTEEDLLIAESFLKRRLS